MHARRKAISKRHEMPLNNILEFEIFDIWGIDFRVYLVVVNYMSKWVEIVAQPTNNFKVVSKFLRKHIFTRFGTPRAIINDGGAHFLNQTMKNLLAKYGVRHKVATTYHP